MQSLAQVGYETSDQHKGDGKISTERDNKDISLLVNYFERSSPFEGHPDILRSLSSGLAASKTCNVQESKAVGTKILESMTGSLVEEYVFRKNQQAVLMTAKNESS